MSVASYLQALGVSLEAAFLGGLVVLIVLGVIHLVLLLRAHRALQERVQAQTEEIARLRDDALYRAPAKAAVAAMLVADQDRSQNLAAIESQLGQLLDEWEHVESLSEEAYDILKELRARAPSEAA
jgi:hypothetical protein